MGRPYDIENTVNGVRERVGDRIRHYAGEAADRADDLMERGRDARRRFGRNRNTYARRIGHAAEDFADEANYQYRRLRRHVSRHPVATTAIVAGTVGAFLLLRHLFRDQDED
ncbi:hypothetical protein P5Y53_20210 [Dyella jiangningensis]|uniref:hypothetical protein n=1 Tax=Dyella jiangningensis TaxID=1379159 RepID=UPI00240F0989|nr:hypothetical protein [Dyella jiangningensis]MDG2540011.1 hypothetical protein [Dyella jiangningensis]